MTRKVSVFSALLLAFPAGAGTPPKRTPELLEKGKASFEVNCAACHGASGAGDGIAAEALDPRPRSFVSEPFEYGSKPAQIFETLTKGVPGTQMIAFKDLPESERWALAYWVSELAAKGKKK